MRTVRVQLPASIKQAAEEFARLEGVTLEQFIALAVVEKVCALRPARAFLKARAGSARPADLIPVLRRVPSTPPVPGDETT
jgi:hypothetical protein